MAFKGDSTRALKMRRFKRGVLSARVEWPLMLTVRERKEKAVIKELSL
jgi:hypothetical protein